MLEATMWATGILWRVMWIGLAWITIRYILKNGTGTAKEILMTCGTAIRIGCIRLRMKLIGDLKKEQGSGDQTVETEGSVE